MKRILILDDNLTICLMLKSWLTKKNYKVDTATSVGEAQQKVKNEAYDLILSDIRMPEADGFSFLSWIKRFDSDVLVIMMTSYADIETAVESMKSGAVDYIPKPIEAESLYQKIADALKNHENQKKAEQIREPLIKPEGEIYMSIFPLHAVCPCSLLHRYSYLHAIAHLTHQVDTFAVGIFRQTAGSSNGFFHSAVGRHIVNSRL